MFVILGLFMAGTLGGGGFLVVRFLREFGGMGSAGNVADLSYMPDYIEGFVVVRLAEVLKSPVIEALSARIPQAQAAVLDSNSVIPLKASDIDTVTFGFWRSHVASPLMPAFGTMNPWAGPSIGTGSMCVARLLKPVDPLTLGASRPTEHNGATIYPLGGLAIWMPDPQTVVIGFPVDVEAAIDRPEPESRFQKFDFAGRGGHFQIVAVNEQQPTQMSAWQASGQMVPFVIPPGMPPSMVALQKLPESFRIKSRGGSLRLDFSSRIEARIAIACREAPLASELQQELQSALSGLLPELEKLAGNPMLQQMLAPARSILNSVNVTQSGDAVNVQLQIEESVIEQAMQSLP